MLEKKLCCPSNSDALFIGLQVVSFLNYELGMYNRRLSINASVCDWLILLTSAVSEMKLCYSIAGRRWRGGGGSTINFDWEKRETAYEHAKFAFLCEWSFRSTSLCHTYTSLRRLSWRKYSGLWLLLLFPLFLNKFYSYQNLFNKKIQFCLSPGLFSSSLLHRWNLFPKPTFASRVCQKLPQSRHNLETFWWTNIRLAYEDTCCVTLIKHFQAL